jgi:uncharacterized membrane protein
MVVTWQSSDSTRAGILARGNFSLGADGLVTLLLTLAVVSLCLAGLLALQEYWPILLIAVIQLVRHIKCAIEKHSAMKGAFNS